MDVMTIVTDRILADLERGVVPWRKPWCSVNTGAYNRITGKPYSVMNQLLLRHSGEYATYRQWTGAGGAIKKGAQSEFVVFWKWPDASETDDYLVSGRDFETDNGDSDTADYINRGTDHMDQKKSPTLRYYRVFHISQVEGVKPKQQNPVFPTEPIDVAEECFQRYIQREGIRFEADLSDEAYYSPVRDLIHVPSLAQYTPENVISYYNTLYHEVCHSSGHAKRLNREGLKHVSFGSETYSREELVAEIGSACILNSLGISTEETMMNSSAYIQGWLSALNRDKRIVVFASSQAEKAVRYIMGDMITMQ